MQFVFPAAYHWDSHGFFVENVFAFDTVSAHAYAMVGTEDDKGIVEYSAFFQCPDDTSYIFVYSGDAGVIVADMCAEIISFGSSFGGYIWFLGCQCLYIDMGIALLE